MSVLINRGTGDGEQEAPARATDARVGMFRAIAIIGILQVLTIIVQIVRSKAISLVLGPAGLGIVGLIDQLITVVATVCALSLPMVVLRVMSRVYGEPAFGRQFAAFLRAIVAASVIGSGALGIALIVRPALFGDVVVVHATEFGIALVSVPLLAVGLLLPNVLAASMRPVGAAWLSFGVAATATVAAVAGILLGGIREIYIAQAVATGALLVIALVYFKHVLHLPFHDSSASLIKEIRDRPDILPTAGAVYAAVVGSAVSLLILRYVTVHSFGAEVGGWLQSILSMVLAVGAVLMAMSLRYLSPVLNRPSPMAEKFAVFDMFRRRQLVILIALAVPLVLFAKIALIIMFSSKFTGAAVWLPAFLVWQLIVIQTNVQMQLLFALDELWIVTVKSIAGSMVSALLCVALIPHYGLDGAAAAMIAGAAVALFIGNQRLRRHGYVIPRSSWSLGGYATLALLAAPLAMQRILCDSIPLKIAACFLLVGGLWPFLERDEKATFKRLLRRSVVRRSAG